MVENRVSGLGTYLKLYNMSSKPKPKQKIFYSQPRLIDRMRYSKINADCSKHGFYLMASILEKRLSNIKCK